MDRMTCPLATMLVGLFLVLVGSGFTLFGVKSYYGMWATETLTIRNNSKAFVEWVNPKSPAILKIYVFNVTNADEIHKGWKPKLAEIGPYIYEHTTQKIHVHTTHKTSVMYRVNSTLRFKADASGNLTELDDIIILNIPLVDALLSTHEVDTLGEKPEPIHSDMSNIFITTNVKELMTDGLTVNCSSSWRGGDIACKAFKTRRPLTLRKIGDTLKFVLFRHLKGEAMPETYTVDSGLSNVQNTGQIIGVDHFSSLKLWRTSYCNVIKGSDGGQFPMPLTKDKNHRLYVFERDICRSFYMGFERVVKERDLELYRYVGHKSVLQPDDDDPTNECFCRVPYNSKRSVNVQFNRSLVCLGNGLLSLFPCTGSFLVASNPHFYLSGKRHIHYSGLTPSKQLHETYYDIEPNSGVTITRCKRLQINMDLRKIDNVNRSSNFKSGIFPVFWAEDLTQASDDVVDIIVTGLFLKRALQKGAIAMIALGSFLFTVPYPLYLAVTKGPVLCRKRQTFPSKAKAEGKVTDDWDNDGKIVKSRYDLLENSKIDRNVNLANILALDINGDFSKRLRGHHYN